MIFHGRCSEKAHCQDVINNMASSPLIGYIILWSHFTIICSQDTKHLISLHYMFTGYKTPHNELNFVQHLKLSLNLNCTCSRIKPGHGNHNNATLLQHNDRSYILHNYTSQNLFLFIHFLKLVSTLPGSRTIIPSTWCEPYLFNKITRYVFETIQLSPPPVMRLHTISYC